MEEPGNSGTQSPLDEPSPAITEMEEERKEQPAEGGDEVLTAKAQSLMDKITASPENPSSNVLHALSTILETQENRYMEEADHYSTNNGRSSHIVGELGNLIRENDEFFELISSKFLIESRYPVSVKAATTRLLYICSLNWMYPYIFEEDVLNNIRGWLMEEIPRSSGDDRIWKHDSGKRKPLDSEMLRTYSTGLLAVCLAGGGQLVEDVLISGLPAKLMRYLRIRVLGDTSINQKDAGPLIDNKSTSNMSCSKTKEEGRGRLRQVTESSHLDLDSLRIYPTERECDRDPASLDFPDRDIERSVGRQACGDECWGDEDSMDLGVYGYEVAAAGKEKYEFRDIYESKTKPSGRFLSVEDFDEYVRDNSTRRRANSGFSRSRSKGRSSEGASESEQPLTFAGSINRSGSGRNVKDSFMIRNHDPRRVPDVKTGLGRNSSDSVVPERADNDNCFQECKVGSIDIIELVKKAVEVAEAEAKTANAPLAAIRAAGDAAAEVVKTAAWEEYRKTNDDEAAMVAASRAAYTVIDAANAVALSKNLVGGSGKSKSVELESNEGIVEYSTPDNCSLSKLRERFCIQCLVILGEYVEVLGPVLHEKGVDACIGLLQRSFKHKEASDSKLLLPDILKLICALASHRKFAALFVDRGGIQRLLSVVRNTQTFFGLSSCLFTIGSIQGIMERVCALPSNIVHQVVELALQLLECQEDHQARKNAALFFAAAFVFKAVIDAFDAQDGLHKLLCLLHTATSVRSSAPLGPSNNSGSLRNDRSPAEALTSSEKQIVYHTSIALRQYFRAHLLLLVDLVRPNKNIRSVSQNISRAAYKPLDISNEAMDTVFRQIQKDRKLGLALVKARWPVVDKFLGFNGHITMLELCQAPQADRDLLQYALGILHIITLVPYSRKLIVRATVSNGRVGIAVILDAANCTNTNSVAPEIVEPALNLLINLVCPPPSLSNKPSSTMQSQQASSIQAGNGSNLESRDRCVPDVAQNEPSTRNGEPTSLDRGVLSIVSSSVGNASTQASTSTVASGLVGDRRISLGAGAGCVGLAAQLEQGYRHTREAVRANNGIKVLLQLLQSRMVISPSSVDCLRALTCRVLLGLARDDTIAQILTKLQVGKKLSELIRDTGNHTSCGEQNRWQAELIQVAIELIGVVTNSGRASTLTASDAATPTLRRIERAAIAAATPISYHSRELLLLIHEHLQASGLAESASALLKEAKLTPLPCLAALSSLSHQASGQETSSIQVQWPSGRAPCGFLLDKSKVSPRLRRSIFTCDSAVSPSKKKSLSFRSAHGYSKVLSRAEDKSVIDCKVSVSSPKVSVAADAGGTPTVYTMRSGDTDFPNRTPIVLAMKRKFTDLNELELVSSPKRLHTTEHTLRSPVVTTPVNVRRSGLQPDANLLFSPGSTTPKDHHSRLLPTISSSEIYDSRTSLPQHGIPNDLQPTGFERLTLDSIVVQYLKQQHRHCPAPITTLPPLSLLHPHVCPEPRRSLDAPLNVTSRLSSREFRSMCGGIHGRRRDRQFVYSRFRPWRTCRDDSSTLLTCIAFLGDSSRIVTGGHTGELKVFDCNSNNVLENCTSHQSPLTLLQSHTFGDTQLVLSSSTVDVRLWDASSVSAGPKHSFEGVKAARFSNSGAMFAALPSDASQKEVLLFDTQSCQLDSTLSDASNNLSGHGNSYYQLHFSPSDSMLLWNGVLWDRRGTCPVHRFDQFTDYGGGSFHPAGNEVIINSEVWDLRNFRLLRSVPSLDQTVITFNGNGDVIYAILRRNLEDVASAFNNRRAKHPLFSAFRTVDAVNYSDIATIPVDRCVLNFAADPTDTSVGLITMDDQNEMYSSARVYEIGRRKPTDDDSDPDDGESEEEDEGDDNSVLEGDLEEVDSDGDNSLNEIGDDDEEDGDFTMDGDGIGEIVTEGDESEVDESYNTEDEGDLSP